jgi:saccharopine dehydrogenase (NADP+, L-glutamate forming)
MNTVTMNSSPLASRRLENAQALVKEYPAATAVSCDINDEKAIEDLVAQHDLVIR